MPGPSAPSRLSSIGLRIWIAFDTVAIYESLATEQIKNAEGRWGKLHVYYPSVNIWSDHPYAILVSDETSAEMKDAALAFEDYLYSPAVQQTALRFGLRPANPDVPILTNDADNPFNKYKDYGFEAAIGRCAGNGFPVRIAANPDEQSFVGVDGHVAAAEVLGQPGDVALGVGFEIGGIHVAAASKPPKIAPTTRSLAQWLIFGVVSPGAALIIGPVLISAPYALARSLTNRFLSAAKPR